MRHEYSWRYAIDAFVVFSRKLGVSALAFAGVSARARTVRRHSALGYRHPRRSANGPQAENALPIRMNHSAGASPVLPTLYCHIGMHKTGTSAFQDLCDLNRDALLKQGLRYHSRRNQNFFRAALTQGGTGRGNFLKSLKAEIIASKGNNFLVSGEDISYLSKDDVLSLREVFCEEFENIRIIISVRQPISYVNSAAQEILKDPTSTFLTLFRRADVTPCYEWRLQKFAEVFGKDHIHLIPYSSNVIKDLMDFVGVNFTAHNNLKNVRVSTWVAKQMILIKPLRSWDESYRAVALFSDMNRGETGPFMAPSELLAHWNDRIIRDCQWLEREWVMPSGFFEEVAAPPPMKDLFTYSEQDVRAALDVMKIIKS